MIALLLLLMAVEPAVMPSPNTEAQRFEACAELAETDPARAIEQAGMWRMTGGGVAARQCEGLAFVTQKRWLPAATAFEAAARDADTKADGRAGTLWVQAGNAALAAGDPARARTAFDAALVRGQATGADLGEIYLDRSRARFGTGDKAGARTDIDIALKLVPADPLAWLLSATLARQTGDMKRAATDIAAAQVRSPDDALVALEAGNIAILSGNDSAARTAWQTAVRFAPASPAGKAAADSLSRLDPPPSPSR